MTINGGHFSDLITDNPVKIGYQIVGGVDHHCYVQTTRDDQITCRMGRDYTRKPGEAELIVFASTSEEATIAPGLHKYFNFIDSDALATISSMTQSFDTSLNVHKITFTGTGISTANTNSNVDVLIGGIAQ